MLQETDLKNKPKNDKNKKESKKDSLNFANLKDQTMESIKQILIRRDNMTSEDADTLITEAKFALDDYLSEGNESAAYNICSEYFGLEPDYLDELI